MIKSRAVKFAITCGFVFGLSGSAMATTLTYSFTGVTDSVDNEGATLVGTIGSSIVGQFSFDLIAPTMVDPNYLGWAGSWTANVSVDGNPFVIDTPLQGSIVQYLVTDNWSLFTRNLDSVRLGLYLELSNPGLPISPSITPGALANYETAIFVFGGGNFESTRFRGHLTNLELVSEVPLPAALPLFAAGLGAMGFMGWRRKRKALAN